MWLSLDGLRDGGRLFSLRRESRIESGDGMLD